MSDDRLSSFLRAQPRLFGIAYRILGSAAEAEDLVQDVWLRWQGADRSQVLNAHAFLAVITRRLAINRLRALGPRREGHDAPELPSACEGPEPRIERAEVLEQAMVLLLEKLSPRERAAYVLREAFNYPYLHIAAVLRVSEVASRQLVTRARRHMTDPRRLPASSSAQRRLFDAFLTAAQSGDVGALEGMFAAEAHAC